MNQYIFVFLQSCFAGLLLGQFINLAHYRWSDHWLLYLTVMICFSAAVIISYAKKQLQQLLFKHLSFRWISFFPALLNASILFLLLAPLVFQIGEGFNGVLILQLCTLFALTMVLLESRFLEQDVLQNIRTDLGGSEKPLVWGNYLMFLLGVASFCLLSLALYRASAGGVQDIILSSLWPGSILFLSVLAVKIAAYKRLTLTVKEREKSFISLESQAPADSSIRQEHYFLEKNIEKAILKSLPEERSFLYHRIRQIPLIDKLDELEAIQSSYLSNDDELAATILFLKRIKKALPETGARYDIDVIEDLMLVKGYIRNVIREKKPMLVQKLLQDNRPEVRKAAIYASVHFQEAGFIPVLVNLLKEPEFAFSAQEALFEIGDQCIPFLRSAKYRNKDNSFFLSRCLELGGRYKTNEARDFLLEMLNEPHKRFQCKAAAALLQNGNTLSALQKTQVRQLIESLIGQIAVQREIYLSLEEERSLLKEALLEEENEKTADVIELLKAFLPRSVQQFIKNSSEERALRTPFTLYALIDLFFPLILRSKCKVLLGSDLRENIAPKLQPEYTSEQIYFRHENSAEAIRHILSMNWGQVGYWLRACALKQLGQLSGQTVSTQILAEVFNENPLLQETACEVLHSLDYDYYFLYMQRLSPERAKELRYKIESAKAPDKDFDRSDSYLLHQQILFLRSVSIFKQHTYESLARHAGLFSLHTFREEKSVLNLDPYKANGYWIVRKGSFTIYHRGEKLVKAVEGDIVDLSFLSEAEMNSVIIHAKNLPQVYFIEYSTLNNLYLSSDFCQGSVTQPRITYLSKAILV